MKEWVVVWSGVTSVEGLWRNGRAISAKSPMDEDGNGN